MAVEIRRLRSLTLILGKAGRSQLKTGSFLPIGPYGRIVGEDGATMGFVLEFDARNNILRVTVEGRMTDAVMSDGYAAATKYVLTHLPCRGIIDLSKVTEYDVSLEALRRLAETSPESAPGDIRIVIAPADHVYGMHRMFQILADKPRPNLHIVRTTDEAYRLLRVEVPEFSPVS